MTGTDGDCQLRNRVMQRVHATLERHLPEKRLFLRSDTETRFIRLRSETQLVAWTGAIVVLAWTIIATAILLMDSIGAGNFRAQAQRDKLVYEDRLNALSAERDLRLTETAAAQDRFASALAQISVMQTELLNSEDARREVETGLDVVQATLRRTMIEREAAREQTQALLADGLGSAASLPLGDTLSGTVDILADALAETADERDQIAEDAAYAIQEAQDLEQALRLMQDRNDEIFRQLEDAMLVSVAPLDDMFRAAGLDPDDIIDQVRRGYSGIGGPLTPLQFSAMGAEPDADGLRANAILRSMDQINLYRIAAERLPFTLPLRDAYRLTSDFGTRWGRLHGGIDMAAPTGTPIYAPADGVVTFAGWSSGYGKLVRIQHEFGIETRYAHQDVIRVEVGQRVSRGDRIGDIGNTGRSTGPHLHYEVRVGGETVDPMIYIRAGNDVF